MKIFAASLVTETNTFSPMPTSANDFESVRPADVKDEEIKSIGALPLWNNMAKEKGFDFTWSLVAGAQPAGRTVQAAYEAFRDEICEGLKAAMPVDMVLLDLHGAMVAQDQDDCEGNLMSHVRDIVGPDIIIGSVMDPHCHLTDLMGKTCDLMLLYKEYPHTDIINCAKEVFDLGVKFQQGKIKPKTAVFDCKMVKTFPTSVEPMRSFVDDMKEREKQSDVLSLSLAHGFPYGDTAEAGTKMIAIADNDQDLAQKLAQEFGQRIVDMRHEQLMDFLPMEEALSKACASDKSTVVVADIADNPGGGAPSDSTFALKWLIQNKVDNAAIAFMWDPIVVQIAKAAGKGATLDVRLGGKMGPTSGDPLDMTVTITNVIENFEYELDFHKNDDGEAMKIGMGDCVALNCNGIDIIVSNLRSQCFAPSAFIAMGIDPTQKKILIPKSTQHFYAGFSPIAGEVIYMSTPGALNTDIATIPYKVMGKNKYPWIDNPF